MLRRDFTYRRHPPDFRRPSAVAFPLAASHPFPATVQLRAFWGQYWPLDLSAFDLDQRVRLAAFDFLDQQAQRTYDAALNRRQLSEHFIKIASARIIPAPCRIDVSYTACMKTFKPCTPDQSFAATPGAAHQRCGRLRPRSHSDPRHLRDERRAGPTAAPTGADSGAALGESMQPRPKEATS